MSKEELFDIDVHYDKLLEWLSSRKKIPVKWQENVVSIREQITNALTNLPILPQITEILGGTCMLLVMIEISYFRHYLLSLCGHF